MHLVAEAAAYATDHDALGEMHRAAGNDEAAAAHFRASEAAHALMLAALDVADMDRPFVVPAGSVRFVKIVPGAPA